MTMWRTVLMAGFICLLTAGAAQAQAVAGSQVSGVVKDSTGGVLPGVEVTITKTDTGAVRTILPVAPPFESRISADGRTLLVERPGLESDLWLMEMGKQ